MDYEEATCNSTKTKSEPQLQSDENWEFQSRSIFWKYSDTIQIMEEEVKC